MTKTTIGIDGMACAMCETHVNDAIRRHFDVRDVRSSRRKGRCVVISDEELDEARVREVIAETGYDLLSVSSEPYAGKELLGRW